MNGNSTDAEDGAKTRRIAVIAIHGVGDHQPEEMARAAASLLESRRTGGADRYERFAGNSFRIHVNPVLITRNVPEKSFAWGPMDAFRMHRQRALAAAAAGMDSVDHVFMQGQLSKYKDEGPEEMYEYLRLDGTRKAVGAHPQKRVHVYDMFWSDLSGVSQTGLKVFGALYQLLLHLGSIGVTNVAAAASFFQNQPGVESKWGRFTRAQKFASGTIAFPVALLNVILAAIALSVFATIGLANITPTAQSAVAVGILVLVVAALGSLGIYRSFRTGGRLSVVYGLPILLVLVSAALVAVFRHDGSLPPEASQAVVAGAAGCLAVLAAAWIVSAYNRRRPGATKAFWICLGATIAITIATCVWRPPGVGDRYLAAAFLVRCADVTCRLLVIVWAGFLGFLVWAWIAGQMAVHAVRSDEAEAERARRTNCTARLTLSLPATLFLLVSIATLAGLVHAAGPILPRNEFLSPESHLSKQQIASLCPRSADTFCYRSLSNATAPVRTWADETLYAAGMDSMPVLLVLTGIAALIALYAVAPSVLDEVVAPPRGADPGQSEALGHWLTSGFALLRWAGWCLYAGVLAFPILSAAGLLSWFEIPNTNLPLSDALGGVIAGTAAGVLGFGGRLSKLALGLRTGVRVALDVDNWLREHPRGDNPTANISARYTSLLRQVVQWRDERDQTRGYDALVIFAHSQGTVITADLLRFLQVEAGNAGGFSHYDRSLDGLRQMDIYFFTVGCPLRQLYAQRFPYIYGYAHKAGINGPDPADLGVKSWMNAYRTGDYVGRFLWRDDDPWDPGSHYESGSISEYAVGPGAHTHYWDSTADRVAETLDAIVAQA